MLYKFMLNLASRPDNTSRIAFFLVNITCIDRNAGNLGIMKIQFEELLDLFRVYTRIRDNDNQIHKQMPEGRFLAWVATDVTSVPYISRSIELDLEIWSLVENGLSFMQERNMEEEQEFHVSWEGLDSADKTIDVGECKEDSFCSSQPSLQRNIEEQEGKQIKCQSKQTGGRWSLELGNKAEDTEMQQRNRREWKWKCIRERQGKWKIFCQFSSKEMDLGLFFAWLDLAIWQECTCTLFWTIHCDFLLSGLMIWVPVFFMELRAMESSDAFENNLKSKDVVAKIVCSSFCS